jgi:hypothetical protein
MKRTELELEFYPGSLSKLSNSETKSLHWYIRKLNCQIHIHIPNRVVVLIALDYGKFYFVRTISFA